MDAASGGAGAPESVAPGPAVAERPVVVIATYDERSNVERLLPMLLEQRPRLRVIVVDDASPDGTAEVVAREAERHPGRIELVRRSGKLGYGSAFVEGFGRALAGDADAVLSMDADFSHDPAAIPGLLAALERHDLAIGSRYVNGIRILNWTLGRLLLSRAANAYVGLLLPSPVVDRTSGFRAYRADALRALDLGRARSNGYAFLVELLELAILEGLRVGEVPIVYEDREYGRSKMDRRVLLEAIWRPWLLLARRIAARLRG